LVVRFHDELTAEGKRIFGLKLSPDDDPAHWPFSRWRPELAHPLRLSSLLQEMSLDQVSARIVMMQRMQVPLDSCRYVYMNHLSRIWQREQVLKLWLHAVFTSREGAMFAC